MKETYEYVVIQLSPNRLRGEVLNAGVVVFLPTGNVLVRIDAPISKLRLLDPSVTKSTYAELTELITDACGFRKDSATRVSTLVSLGLCKPGEPSFFVCAKGELNSEVRRVLDLYVTTRNQSSTLPKSKLLTEMITRLRSMSMLGESEDDIGKHLVVPNVPIPNHPDLSGDLVYKNGVYRITQTVDYAASPATAHRRIREVCAKVMAASVAENVWGENLMRFAVVRVPDEVADVAEPHLRLLKTSKFEVFNFEDQHELAEFHEAAFAA